MDKVIGLGETGCGIAEEFSSYPEYRIYKIGSPTPGDRANLDINPQPHIEAYEASADPVEISSYLRSIRGGDEVLFVLGGGEPISGLALIILEQISEAQVTVVYVVPDLTLANETQRRDNKIVFNVLQEYARSGLMSSLFLVDRLRVEEMVGDVSIREFDKSVYNLISYVVAMVNYYDHTDAVLSNKATPNNICRIGTFGVSSLEEDAEKKYLFKLSAERDAHYYFGIPHGELNDSNTLMRDIKTQTKKFIKGDVNGSFSVYSTTFDKLMVLFTAYSKEIQKLPRSSPT
jgi:hypothetical protein